MDEKDVLCEGGAKGNLNGNGNKNGNEKENENGTPKVGENPNRNETIKANDINNGEEKREKGSDDEDENKCGICLESIETVADLDSCEHKFCFDCIMHWVKIVSVCPLCKKQIHKIKKVKNDVDDDDDDDEPGEKGKKKTKKRGKKKKKRNNREIYYIRKRKMYIPDDPSMTEEEARALWFKEKLDALRRAASFVDSYESGENFDVLKKK